MRTAAGVTFFAATTPATRSRRSSATGAMPTFSFPETVAAAPVSALKSVVFPALGRPTMPTSRATPYAVAAKPICVSRPERRT